MTLFSYETYLANTKLNPFSYKCSSCGGELFNSLFKTGSFEGAMYRFFSFLPGGFYRFSDFYQSEKKKKLCCISLKKIVLFFSLLQMKCALLTGTVLFVGPKAPLDRSQVSPVHLTSMTSIIKVHSFNLF